MLQRPTLIGETHLEILGDTVPDVNTLEVRVITVVESTAVSFKLVGELDSNQYKGSLIVD